MDGAEAATDRRFPAAGCALLLAAMLAVQSLGVTRPWVGAHDWNGAAWASAARNLLRHPLRETRGGVFLSHHLPTPPDRRTAYVHHPPLIVWLVTASTAMFGDCEWAARLVPMAAGALGLLALTALLARHWGRAAALAGGAAFALAPTQLFYGKMPNHEPLALPLILIAAWRAGHWLERPTAANAAWCGLAVFAACWSGWAACLFAAACGIGSLFACPHRSRGLFAACAVGSGAAVLSYGAYVQQLRPDGVDDLFRAFGTRAGQPGADAWEWCRTVGHAAVRLLSPAGLAALAAVPFLLRRAGARGAVLLLPLAAAGVGNVLLFRQGAFVHEYYLHYLLGAAALAAGAFWGAAGETARRLAAGLLAAHALHAAAATDALLQRQSMYFAAGTAESRDFIVAFGAELARRVPPETPIVVNCPPHGEQAGYYSGRQALTASLVGDAALPEWLERQAETGAGACIYPGAWRGGAILTAWERLPGRRWRRSAFAVEGREFVLLLPI